MLKRNKVIRNCSSSVDVLIANEAEHECISYWWQATVCWACVYCVFLVVKVQQTIQEV